MQDAHGRPVIPMLPRPAWITPDEYARGLLKMCLDAGDRLRHFARRLKIESGRLRAWYRDEHAELGDYDLPRLTRMVRARASEITSARIYALVDEMRRKEAAIYAAEAERQRRKAELRSIGADLARG